MLPLMRFLPSSSFLRKHPLLYSIPLPTAFYFATMSTSSPADASSPNNTSAGPENPASVRPYTSHHPNLPYTPADFSRADEAEDEDFYSSPRFVTHIDDHAISVLKRYYSTELPRKGRILDLCSSWISHFPRELEEKARTRDAASDGAGEERLEVVGLGMNKKELDANPILSERILQNLNTKARLPEQVGLLDATVCVVSIDYLTSPVEVLASIHKATRLGGRVHLVVSNRCFPTKAVGRWLRVGEQERLNMVGEYLWWSGWRELEIVELCDGSLKEGEQEQSEGVKGELAELMRSIGMGGGRVDPLWVVRGRKTEGEESKEEGGGIERSEL